MSKGTTNRAASHSPPAGEEFEDEVQQVLLFEPVQTEAQKFLCRLKEEIRHCVLSARDADATLRLLDTYRPATIVIGCSGAADEGFRFLRAVRQNPLLESAHVVVFSAAHADPDICEAFTLGANRFFLKPGDDVDYGECAIAIVARESNLPPNIAKFERFPVDPFCD